MGNYDKLILIAGGSGAAFTFGVMNRLMMQCEKLAVQSIEFIWAVRHVGMSMSSLNYTKSVSDD
jgi:hypothetical protein